MQAAAHRGPTAVINVSKYRCDVILVEEQQIRSLGLTGLNCKDITEKVQGSDLASPEVPRWLWDAVANPILNALGFTRHLSVNNWPHVWWIPTGALIRPPPHVAGITDNCFGTVLNRVMSSYISSIKTIIGGRRQVMPSTSAGALLVAMESGRSFQTSLHKLKR